MIVISLKRKKLIIVSFAKSGYRFMGKINPGKTGTKKDVITKKAASLFIEKGFSATSMRDLAEAVGIEAPSLYNHITGKHEILQEICYKVANLFTVHMNKVESEKDLTIIKIEQIIRFHIRMMLEEYESVYISDHEWKHLTEPYLSNFKNQRKGYRARLAGIVKLGIDNNEIKKFDPYVVVLTMLSAIGGIEIWHRSKKVLIRIPWKKTSFLYLLKASASTIKIKRVGFTFSHFNDKRDTKGNP